jgi:hypothetical protein
MFECRRIELIPATDEEVAADYEDNKAQEIANVIRRFK